MSSPTGLPFCKPPLAASYCASSVPTLTCVVCSVPFSSSTVAGRADRLHGDAKALERPVLFLLFLPLDEGWVERREPWFRALLGA